jgi:hypothetical protein
VSFAILDSNGSVIARIKLRDVAKVAARVARHPALIFRRSALEAAILEALTDFARRELHSR